MSSFVTSLELSFFVSYPHRIYRFVDTAGIRKRGKVQYGSEFFMVNRALKAIRRSDVVVLVLDAVAGVSDQDRVLAERIAADGRACVVVLNKWELLNTEQREKIAFDIERKLGFLEDPPVLRISALTGKGVNRLWPQLQQAVGDYRTRIPTRDVNRSIRAAQSAQPAPHGARVMYATQGATDPPTFTLFANRELPPTYVRYLERKLREDFDLGSTPIKLRVRRRND